LSSDPFSIDSSEEKRQHCHSNLEEKLVGLFGFVSIDHENDLELRGKFFSKVDEVEIEDDSSHEDENDLDESVEMEMNRYLYFRTETLRSDLLARIEELRLEECRSNSSDSFPEEWLDQVQRRRKQELESELR